jgi:hypothetical protein
VPGARVPTLLLPGVRGIRLLTAPSGPAFFNQSNVKQKVQ